MRPTDRGALLIAGSAAIGLVVSVYNYVAKVSLEAYRWILEPYRWTRRKDIERKAPN